MTCDAAETGLFSHELKDMFISSGAGTRVSVRKYQYIYTSDDSSRMIYFVESGSIGISRQSADGKVCLLRIQLAGEVFGEFALVAAGCRFETATAREKGFVWRIHAEEFIQELRRRMLLESFICNLILRVADQDRRISHFVTEPSKRRLGKSLLLLARRIGIRRGDSLIIHTRLSHQELAEMVGMTRPQVSTFLCDFKRHNLIGVTDGRQLVIFEDRLKQYLKYI